MTAPEAEHQASLAPADGRGLASHGSSLQPEGPGGTLRSPEEPRGARAGPRKKACERVTDKPWGPNVRLSLPSLLVVRSSRFVHSFAASPRLVLRPRSAPAPASSSSVPKLHLTKDTVPSLIGQCLSNTRDPNSLVRTAIFKLSYQPPALNNMISSRHAT